MGLGTGGDEDRMVDGRVIGVSWVGTMSGEFLVVPCCVVREGAGADHDHGDITDMP